MTQNFSKGRGGYKIIAIVLHITEGSSQSALSWFNNPNSQVSCHWLINEDGQKIQIVDENDTAWGCGKIVNPKWKGLISGINPNLYTINVETALPNYWTLPKWNQWIETAKLVKEICERWNLPLDEEHIISHNMIRADKKCSGWWITPWYILTFIKLFI